MYSHQQGSHYGPPRYERPPYQQQGYRPSQPPRNYNGPPRPIRGLHHRKYFYVHNLVLKILWGKDHGPLELS